jgi:hypothetical protein
MVAQPEAVAVVGVDGSHDDAAELSGVAGVGPPHAGDRLRGPAGPEDTLDEVPPGRGQPSQLARSSLQLVCRPVMHASGDLALPPLCVESSRSHGTTSATPDGSAPTAMVFEW